MTPKSYADYLNLDSLMSLQEPHVPLTASRDVVQAERFFIVAHQACELWLGQIVGDIDAAIAGLTGPRDGAVLEISLEYLDRAQQVLRILEEHVACLEKLPLVGFAEFRPHLGTASGAQSTGFHLLDLRLGDEYRTSPLYEALVGAVATTGMSVDDLCRQGARAGVLYRISEALIGLGGGYWRWKVAHVALVSRVLGGQAGTAGTSGGGHLVARLSMPFRELRMIRGRIGAERARETPDLPDDQSCPFPRMPNPSAA